MMEDYPRRSVVVVAGDRKSDMYMGIDVFGKNTYGCRMRNVCDVSYTHFYLIATNYVLLY